MTAKTAAEKIGTSAADAQNTASAQIEKFARGFEDVAAFNQDNVQALVKSSNVAAKAAEDLSAEAMAFAKKSVEEGVAAAKDLAGIKNVAELVEKQADFAKVSMNAFVRQAAKMNDLYLVAAKEASAPFNARVTAMAEMVKDFRA